MDTAYLKEHVGRALTLGLTEIAQKKPVDPIEYLSKWLRKHVENLKDEADEALAAKELSKQKEKATDEKRRQEALLEEQNLIQNEIMKRKMEQLDQQLPENSLDPDQSSDAKIVVSLDSSEVDLEQPTQPPPSSAQPPIQTITEEEAVVDVDEPIVVQDAEKVKEVTNEKNSSPDRIPVPSVAEVENSDIEEDEREEQKENTTTSHSSNNPVEANQKLQNLDKDDEEELSIKSPLGSSVAGDFNSTGDVDVHNEQLTDSLTVDE